MAKTNDMPEFHSVKVFVTENTPPHRRHGFANTSNAGITSPQGFTGCFTAWNLLLTSKGGQAHV
ncbi:hypothetical protein SG34_026020 [Thalassomonas viridans]|uniref:Uncharacterized protein n=1 Tax=Thalassomonas viridans TaxID=137584 RepID=A0AAE9Z163_9GAMM|nr:hypothetical protein [Thalassomonas viridans]WDE04735.1 hypothetical protein SG34_026020 [Thalassomonas viridans]